MNIKDSIQLTYIWMVLAYYQVRSSLSFDCEDDCEVKEFNSMEGEK